MEVKKLTKQQQKVLTLVYKFRFVNAPLLASMMGIRRESVYGVLEYLLIQKLVVKVYKKEWRIDRKPAYYHLSKSGVTMIPKLLDIKESAVNSIYQDYRATEDFISHCQIVLGCYIPLKQYLPADTSIFTKTEINRFKQFPRNRPDLYIRTSDGNEAIIVIAENKPLYIIGKRLDEILEHSEDGDWEGDYPTIAFILRDERDKYSFLYKTRKKLDDLGMEEGDLSILAVSLPAIYAAHATEWFDVFHPTQPAPLLQRAF